MDDSRLIYKRNIALLTEWEGTDFAGWQLQANAPTIQGELQRALAKILTHKTVLNGCSRTDAGVHAWGHVSNFKTNSRIAVENLPLALNTYLPDRIAVKLAVDVDPQFNARYGAVGKQYSYYIYNSAVRSGIYSRYTYRDSRPLDVNAMRAAAKFLLGTHDFRCFMASGGQVKTTVRTIHKLEVLTDGAIVRIIVRGNGFLYNMVRIIAGTLLYVGLGKLQVADISLILASKDRAKAGKTLPACGLFLDEVFYEPEIFQSQGEQICRLTGMTPKI